MELQSTSGVKSQHLHDFHLPPLANRTTATNHHNQGSDLAGSRSRSSLLSSRFEFSSPRDHTLKNLPTTAKSSTRKRNAVEECAAGSKNRTYSKSLNVRNGGGGSSSDGSEKIKESSDPVACGVRAVGELKLLLCMKRRGQELPHEELAPKPTNADDSAPKGWNLRPRRQTAATHRHESAGYPNTVDGRKAAPAKFSLSLSEEEKVSDFIAMTGSRPPKKPKKMPRSVQNQLNKLFPGSDLVTITAGMYQVRKTPQRLS